MKRLQSDLDPNPKHWPQSRVEHWISLNLGEKKIVFSEIKAFGIEIANNRGRKTKLYSHLFVDCRNRKTFGIPQSWSCTSNRRTSTVEDNKIRDEIKISYLIIYKWKLYEGKKISAILVIVMNNPQFCQTRPMSIKTFFFIVYLHSCDSNLLKQVSMWRIAVRAGTSLPQLGTRTNYP